MSTIVKKKGIGLVEVVIGVSIMAVFVVAIIVAFRQYLTVGLGNTARLQAAYFAEEGIEIARALRDTSWSTFSALSTSDDFYFTQNSGAWATTSSATTTLKGFIRTMQLDSVYRNTNTHDIVPATSTVSKYLDPDARFIVITVSWIGVKRATTSIQLSTYLTKLF